MYYWDLPYLALVFISLILGLATQGYIKRQYGKWSEVPGTQGVSGASVARRMLDTNGASAVGITHVSGHLTDFYDPRDNNLHLSDENFQGGSVASVAVACHEAGHAVQTAKGYLPGRIRTAIVPAVNIAQSLWSWVFIFGLFMPMFTIGGYNLMQIGIFLYAIPVIFQLVTLPVEIDASRRAVRYIGSTGSLTDERGARQVLTAAALTYVAAALVSILQLLYLIGRANNRD